MRQMLRPVAALFAAAALWACAQQSPPAGRWQGAYEDSEMMVAVRLEIDQAGTIRVTAPNALADFKAMSKGDRTELRHHLEAGLSRSWPAVTPLPLEFDGKTFRKPGGIAPQLEWESSAKRMTMVFYSSDRPSIRIALNQVPEFGP